MQLGMLYHRVLAEESTEYFLQQSFILRGELGLNLLEESLALISKKYDVLRTVILYKKVAEPKQVVLKERRIEFSQLDVSELPRSEKEHAVEAIKKDNLSRGFDLEKDSLLRLTAVKLTDKETNLIWSAHHIILDGWCFPLIFKDFMANYVSLEKGKSTEELLRQISQEKADIGTYQDYVFWLENQNQSEGLAYWRELLNDYNEIAGIAPLGPPINNHNEVANQRMSLSSIDSQALKQLAKTQHVTLSTIIETAWGLILQHYNQQKEVVFGKVVSGRNANIPRIDEIVGLFINTIPVRHQQQPSQSIVDLLKTHQKQAIASSSYDFCSLADIQQMSAIKGELFETLFIYENYYIDEAVYQGIEGIEIEAESEREQTNYPLTLKAFETGVIQFDLMYDPRIYGKNEINLIADRLILVLQQVATNPEKLVDSLVYITDEESLKITHEFNQPLVERPVTSFVELFERQVAEHSAEIALVFEGEQLSYEQFNQQANQVANALQQRGIGAGMFVPLLMTRSVEMLVSMIGVIKAGAAYVPIDPDFPDERIEFILKDCHSRVALTNGQKRRSTVEFLTVAELLIGSTDNPNVKHLETNPIYCIYTSGTTGQPKGVIVNQRNVLNYCLNQTPFLEELRHKSRIVSVTNYTFDIFVTESLFALINNLTIVLANAQQMEDPEAFHQLLQTEEVTAIQTTPSKMKLYTSKLAYFEGFRQLETIGLGGEAFSPDLFKQLRIYTTAKVFNLYGPSEATVWVAGQEITDSYSLGKPFENCQLYVVWNGELCGVGVPGELWIAGESVVTGYQNRPELTEQQFVPNPFGEGRIYRTGDVVRRLEDGTIDYLNRQDDQVKIHGYRIELDEIESVIKKQVKIENVAVIIRPDTMGEMAIHGYFVASEIVSVTWLKNKLKQELPAYMVPMYLKQVEFIPTNSSGKLARSQLPEIILGGQADVKPRTKMEQTVATVFESVLGLKEVGVNGHFFDLGGHSLRLTTAVNQLEAATGSRVALKEIFNHPRVGELAAYMEALKTGSYLPIPVAEEMTVYPMSSGQKRLFALNQIDKSTAYNMPVALKIEGQLSQEHVIRTLQLLIERHEALRTTFAVVEGQPVQQIALNGNANLTEILSVDQSEKALLREFVQPFDLARGPLLRVAMTVNEKESLLFIDMHHIISDGMSLTIFMREFTTLYNGGSLTPIEVHYKDYSQWIGNRDLSQQATYWQKQFADEVPVLDLPLDYPRPHEQDFRGQHVSDWFDGAIKEQISQLAKRTETTEYMVFMAIYMILLSKYSLQDELVVGSPISGRLHRDTESMLGMFVNTLAIKSQPNPDKLFLTFLAEVKATCLEAYENQEYPFEELVEQAGITRSFARNPLFDTMFVLQNNETLPLKLGDKVVSIVDPLETPAKFDLTLTISEEKEGYLVDLNYATGLFKAESMSWLLQHFMSLVTTVCEQPRRTIRSLSVMDQNELRLMNQLNQTGVPYDKQMTVPQLFSASVANNPQKVALIFEDKRLTYEELDQKSDQLARQLVRKGVKPGVFVALAMTKSTEMILSILAVIKAGGAYLAVDPTYPTERIFYMLEDSRPLLLLTNLADFISPVTSLEVQRIACDALNASVNGGALPLVNQSQDVLYCIYTSGTTGRPKGVLVSHQGIVNLQTYFETGLGVSQNDHVLQFANYIFDASVWEITMALLNGGTLHLASKELIEDTERMTAYIDQFIDVAIFPPQYLANLRLSRLRLLMTGGSVANPELIEQNKGAERYVNAYGPSETTICASSWEYTGGSIPATLPIGQPISNAQIHIMVEGQLAGFGMPGELCVSGDNVGLGYLNQPELTAESFITNPFGQGLVYRTGDLARWLPDGTLDYLGRIDKQVKIRGYRIELSEIEYAVRQFPGVKDVAVITREVQHNLELFAYIVPNVNQLLAIKEISQFIGQQLPEYMIPQQMMLIDSLPVTASGKLAEDQLPEIELEQRTYQSPKSKVEEVFVKAYEEVLGITPIGIADDFFELGGDSIKAIRIVSKVREAGYETTVKEILQGPSIQFISQAASRRSSVEVDQAEVTGEVPLTPIQKFFFESQFANPNHFNQALVLEGHSFNSQQLELALESLVEHHDSLRATFSEGAQLFLPVSEKRFKFEVIDLRHLPTQKVEQRIIEMNNQVQQSLSITGGPLLSVLHVQTKGKDYLTICLHHLIVDGVSWRILSADLERAYTQVGKGETVKLPAKTASVKAWTAGLATYVTKQLPAERTYWQEVTAALRAGLISKQPITEQRGQGHLVLGLTKNQTEDLLYKTSHAYGTEVNDLLLTALMRAISNWTGQQQVGVQLEGHGREEVVGVPVDRTVGWFTSIYPILLKNQTSLSDTLVETKEMLRQVPNRGIGYGLLKYETDWTSELSPDVTFNYLGQIDGEKVSEGQFQLSSVSAGETVSDENEMSTGIVMNGRIVEEQLTFNVDFDLNRYPLEEMTRFCSLVEQSLSEVIDHCRGSKVIKTPSD